MASMCGSGKSHPALTTSSFYKPGSYPYQSEYYLPPRSVWSRPPPQTRKNSTKWKIGSAMLIISAMLVLIAVLAVAGLALWMGALRTDTKNAIIGFACSFRIARGERYNPMLKLNTSMVFREKERKYKNIFELLFRRSVLGVSYKQTIIDKFENGTLKVFFRLYLDRRKIPRSITNVEDTIEDILVKETYSASSLFKNMELDLTGISIKRINEEPSTGQKSMQSDQRKNTMITKNGLLRPNRNSSLITGPKSKPKPTKMEPNEAEIDFSNIPTIQGTYKAAKINETALKNDTRIESSEKSSDGNQPGASTDGDTTVNASKLVEDTTPGYVPTSRGNISHEATVAKELPTTTAPVTGGSIIHSKTDKPDSDLFKDFIDPEFETSPWKPIIPGFADTSLKVLPDEYKITSRPGYVSPMTDISTDEPDSKVDGKNTVTRIHQNYGNLDGGSVEVHSFSDETVSDTPQTDSDPDSTKPMTGTATGNSQTPDGGGFDLDNVGIGQSFGSFNGDDSDFPQDRIVPQEMVNFRVNGKFKNKIPTSIERVSSSVHGAIHAVGNDHFDKNDERPEIEVFASLPENTYDVHVKTSDTVRGPGSVGPHVTNSHGTDDLGPNTTGSITTVPYLIPDRIGPAVSATRFTQAVPQIDRHDAMNLVTGKPSKFPDLDDSLRTGSATRPQSKDGTIVVGTTPIVPNRYDTRNPGIPAGTGRPVVPNSHRISSTTEFQMSGIGEAEVVLDMDDVEARNRFSDIEAIGSPEDAMRDRKVDQESPAEPVYTSYRSSDLNGVAKPSLVENSGTSKPFRHTIPVDKITAVSMSAVDDANKTSPVEFVQQFGNNGSDNGDDATEGDPGSMVERTTTVEEFATTMQTPANNDDPGFQSYDVKPTSVGFGIEETDRDTETFPELNEKTDFTVKNAKIELADVREPVKHEPSDMIDDEKILRRTTTEVYAEMLHPFDNNNNNNGLKLVNGQIANDPTAWIYNSRRNSTFVEIDTVKHTPGEAVPVTDFPGGTDSTLSDVNGSMLQGNGKKVYNDTLKANVIENLVTLAPVKSNSGVGRPIRPRPKTDKEKATRIFDEEPPQDHIIGSQDGGQRFSDSEPRDTVKRESFDDEQVTHEIVDNATESGERKKIGELRNFKDSQLEQIVEVVTSISTRISSNVKKDDSRRSDPVANATSLPEIHSEFHGVGQVSESMPVREATEPSHLGEEFPARNTTDQQMPPQTSDRRISVVDENLFLLEKLKQFAEVRTDFLTITTRPKNVSVQKLQNNVRSQVVGNYPNYEELKKLADISTADRTVLKNSSSSNFTPSRDGVMILTKVLNKAEDRTDKMISTTEEIRIKPEEKCMGFRCDDGKCLPSGARCNMLRECARSEDELNCTCASFLKAQLLHHKICDGTADCWDYSDETDCDWCRKGQFVCGNSRSCVDQSKVCDGFRDCPGGEDEKKCAALIEENYPDSGDSSAGTPVRTENAQRTKDIEYPLAGEENTQFERTVDRPPEETLKVTGDDLSKSVDTEHEATDEPYVLETTTFRIVVSNGVKSEKLSNSKDLAAEDGVPPESIESSPQKSSNPNIRDPSVVVSGREIASNTRNSLVHDNSFHTDTKKVESFSDSRENEADGYSDKGFLNVRKNGKWGKLCLTGMDNLLQERQAVWTIEDLGRAVCKAITYRDYERVERVREEKSPFDRRYYSLSYNEKTSDKTSLTFKSSDCPSGEVLKVKCKNLECGVRTQTPSQARSAFLRRSRIVGGGSSTAGSWPWQVALYKEGDYQCGGALLNDKWILSAAHCFYHTQNEYWIGRIGTTRRGSFPSPHEQLIRIDHVALHPEYVDNGFINDIALLRLEKPVSFSDYVRPVCLPENEPKSGETCTITGWGQLFEVGRIFPDTLQEAELPVISTDECRRRTLFLPLYKITSGMLCAGLKDGGRDACLGDSGGPLVCPQSNNRYTLHGITSNGYGCARPGRPGVYTKVHHYVPWIQKTMSKEEITSSVAPCKGHRCPLGECLPKSRICNGYLECSDGSDERNCAAS